MVGTDASSPDARWSGRWSPRLVGVGDQHRRTGGRPQHARRADRRPDQAVDQSGLAGAGGATDHHQQGRVQPGQQYAVCTARRRGPRCCRARPAHPRGRHDGRAETVPGPLTGDAAERGMSLWATAGWPSVVTATAYVPILFGGTRSRPSRIVCRKPQTAAATASISGTLGVADPGCCYRTATVPPATTLGNGYGRGSVITGHK
jgi:hypothetical protein